MADFWVIANWQTRLPIFTLDDVELGKLTVYNVLGD